MRTPEVKYSTNIWKDRLRSSQKECKALRRALKRKDAKIRRLESSLSEQKPLPKNSCRDLKSPAGGVPPGRFGEKPARHQYPTRLIMWSVYFQLILSTSYRQTQSIIGQIILILELECRCPSASTIRVWLHKLSCYELNSPLQVENMEGDWIIILDESAAIGKEKLLLILATPLKKEKSGALGFGDIRVLGLATGNPWKSEDILKVLEKGRERMKGDIAYVLSDRGSNLLGAIKKSGLAGVNDCTHLMAGCLEKFYAKDADFLALTAGLGKIRQKWSGGPYVGLIPPNMRTKSRFLNIFEITEWADKVLRCWDRLDPKAQETLSFLTTHRSLVKEMAQLCRAVKEVSLLLKTKGISHDTIGELRLLFGGYGEKTSNFSHFERMVVGYAVDVKEQFPQYQTIECCSDIIESCFGKYKNRGNKAASTGFTGDVKVISLFNDSLDEAKTKMGMESVKVKDIGHWNENNVVEDFAKTKKKTWQKMGA